MSITDPLSARNLLRIAVDGKAYQVAVIRHQLKPYHDRSAELPPAEARLVEQIVEGLAAVEAALEDLTHRLKKEPT